MSKSFRTISFDKPKARKKFSFENLSKAEPDSDLMEKFKQHIREQLRVDLEGKDFNFVKTVRDCGVTYREAEALSHQLLNNEQVIVLPLIYSLGSEPEEIYIPMKDASDRDEINQLVLDWLNVNGRTHQVTHFCGMNLSPIKESKKTKTYTVSAEVKGEYIILESFKQKPQAHRFADDYLLRNGSRVTVSCVETQDKEVRRGSLSQLNITAFALNEGEISDDGLGLIFKN